MMDHKIQKQSREKPSSEVGVRRRDLRRRSVRSIVDLVERDSRLWRLPPSAALIIAAIPILIVLGMVATVPFPDFFVWITAEDSLLEWLQFLLLLAASLIFAWSGFLLLRSHRGKIGFLFLLVALGAFFVAGEEIAWGQRIFGWSTPESLEAVNSQQETTLHNISSAHPIFVYSMMLVGLYGVLMPIFASIWWNKKQESILHRLLIPPLCLVPAFFMPFGYRFSRLALGVDALFPKLIFVITKFSEVTEVCLYFALLVFAWLNLHSIQWRGPSRARQFNSENNRNQ